MGTASTPPSNVQVFVPVATGVLSVYGAPSGYAGTLYTVDGVQRTKVITLRDWTQESGVNQNIQVYANEQFSSIQDVVVEGSISYLGLATPYLVPGYSISFTGQGYTTGWEALQSSGWPPGLPVSQSEVIFQWNASGTSYLTNISLTNRRQRYTAEVFLRPTVRDQMFGGPPLGAGYGAGWSRAAVLSRIWPGGDGRNDAQRGTARRPERCRWRQPRIPRSDNRRREPPDPAPESG